jgi:hypothetical protein
MVRIRMDKAQELEGLLDAQDYAKHLGAHA